MNREIVRKKKSVSIVTADFNNDNNVKKDDNYLNRLIKYIPYETVAFYAPIINLLKKSESMLIWIVFSIALLGTPIYLIRIEKVTKIRQLIFSTFAFILWAISLGYPFDKFSFFTEINSIIILLCGTFILSIFKPEEDH